MFIMNDEPESLHEETCLRYLMSGITKRGAVFNMYDEPESPDEGTCLR